MTTQDPMTPQERALRDRLHDRLVSPPTPDRLVYAIDRLADDELERASRGRWRVLLDSGASRRVRATIAIAAIVVIASSTLLMGSVLQDRAPVAATPVPTLPAITQPSLPPDAASPLQIVSGRWLDANSAYLVGGTDALGRSGGIFVTADGGQTWRQSGWLQDSGDNGFDMLDAAHGYAGMVDYEATGVSLSVNLTEDGGASWRRQAIGSITSPAIGAAYADVQGDAYSEVHFSDSLHAVALATLMSPWPRGSTPVPCPAPGTNGLGQTCNSVPLACAGFATADGGTTWSSLANVPCLMGYTRWSTPQLGQESSSDTSDVSTTADGGVTWHSAALPGVEKGKSFLSSAHVLTVVSGATLRLAGIVSVDGAGPQPLSVWESGDAGATWRLAYQATPPSTVSAPDQASATDHISDMWAFSADHWIAIVAFDGPSNTRGGLFETWDAGRSWTSMAPQQIGSGVWTWADRLHGMTDGGSWVCNNDNTCSRQRTWLLTNDGGQTWHQLPF